MLQLTTAIAIPREEFTFTFARAGGPGGQNVNKVSSKVLLRWHPASSPSLPDAIKLRFLQQQQHRLTTEGELLITSQQTRDQGKNVDDCLNKLRAMLMLAVHPPKLRRATKPSRGSQRRRLQDKKQQAQKKAGRRRPAND